MPRAQQTKLPSKRQRKPKTQGCPVSTNNDQLTTVDMAYALGFGPQPSIPLQKIKAKMFWCSTCDETIQNVSDQARHWKNIHTNIGEFVGCPFCDLRFERILHNLIKHISGHFVKHRMKCTEALPSGIPCTETFSSPKEWDSHRKKAHQRNYHAYLYTEEGSARNLRATHTPEIFEVVYNDFLRGCPTALSDCIASRETPPIGGAVLVFSPAGMPYFRVETEWKDLLDPTLRANMTRIQTSMGHRFCLEELKAIDQRFLPEAAPSTSESSPDRYSSSLPPLTTRPSSIATAGPSNTSSPCQPMRSRELRADGYHAAPMRHPPFPSSSYGQSLPSSPREPSHQIEERRNCTTCRQDDPHTTVNYSRFPTSTSSSSSSNLTEAFTSYPHPSLTAAREIIEERGGSTVRCQYDAYTTGYRSQFRIPTPPPSGSRKVRHPYPRCRLVPAHFPDRGEYSYDSMSPSPSLSPSPPPSLMYSSSSSLTSLPPHIGYRQSAVRDSPHYNGYTSKAVSRFSPYSRTVPASNDGYSRS
ncbi:hypothetical protein QCA50_019963 [Cerrena zonata]|uniref:C2H2-type domain-containing protein n=1 Tax=Cerrena zonata TaxID=2478898 RepID=A0AAW0FK97_9APHY